MAIISAKSLLTHSIQGVRCGLWQLFLLALSIGVHLVLISWLIHVLYTNHPASAAPKLVVDSIELTLADVESDVVTEPVPMATATAHLPPTPEQAPYLSAPDSAIALPQPPSTLESTAPLPNLPAPEFPLPALPEQTTDLPKITLPPMEIPEETPPQQRPTQQATGATARIQHPRLVTDLAAIQKSYPHEARKNHWEGIVKVKLTINAAGRAETLEVVESSGYRVLDREAVKMLRRAQFTNGPGELIQKVQYSLSK